METDRKLPKSLEANGRQELSDEEKQERERQWRELMERAKSRPPAKRRLRIHFRSPIVIEFRGDFD